MSAWPSTMPLVLRPIGGWHRRWHSSRSKRPPRTRGDKARCAGRARPALPWTYPSCGALLAGTIDLIEALLFLLMAARGRWQRLMLAGRVRRHNGKNGGGSYDTSPWSTRGGHRWKLGRTDDGADTHGSL